MGYFSGLLLPPMRACSGYILNRYCNISFKKMARHVFQYSEWDPKIGCYSGDPSGLPPLTSVTSRPQEADTAGLVWLDNRSYPGRYTGRGNDARSPAIETQQPAPTFAAPAQNYSNQPRAPPIYDAEGRRI